MEWSNELMGTLVRVDAVYQRRKKFHNGGFVASYDKVASPDRVGWVVGHRWLKIGDVQYGWDQEDPTYFEQLGTVETIMVCFWPTYRPVYVPPKHCYQDLANLSPGPTVRYDLEDLREYVQKEMTPWPRDKRGRWIAWNNATDEEKDRIRQIWKGG